MKYTTTMLIAGLCLAATFASAQTSLFTTQQDFSSWTVTGTGLTLTPGTAGDTDLSTVNGLANPSAPGASGTAGALEVSGITATYGQVSAGSSVSAPYVAAIKAGSTISFDITLTGGTGTYFDPVLILNSNSGFVSYDPKIYDNTAGLHHYSVSYASNIPAPTTYLELGFFFNTNTTSNFSVDNITVNAVPAPAAMLPLGLGLIGLLIAKRRS